MNQLFKALIVESIFAVEVLLASYVVELIQPVLIKTGFCRLIVELFDCLFFG